jgi:hypothetical protein
MISDKQATPIIAADAAKRWEPLEQFKSAEQAGRATRDGGNDRKQMQSRYT